jgi:hypothetical protein
MEVFAPELAVRDGLQTNIFLHPYDICDRLVLHRTKLLRRDFPGPENMHVHLPTLRAP